MAKFIKLITEHPECKSLLRKQIEWFVQSFCLYFPDPF